MACCVSMALSGAANPPPSISPGGAERGNRSNPGRVSFNSNPVFSEGRQSSPPAFSAAAPAPNANFMWFAKPTNAAIIVNENESPDSICRRFRREVMSAGIIAECRRRRFHETPQEKKKRKVQALARKRKMSRIRPQGITAFDGGATSGFAGPPRPTFIRPVDPFAPKPPKTKEEDDREFWGDDDDELVFQ